MTAAELLSTLACGRPSCACRRAVAAGHGLTHCPAHDDQHPSLSVRQGDREVVWSCKAGCPQEAVTAAVAELSDRRPSGIIRRSAGSVPNSPPPQPAHPKRWEIRRSDGELQAVHVRIDQEDGGKRFTWQLPDGRSGLHGLAAGDLLYGAEHLSRLDLGELIFLTEGEKAADELRALGLPACATVCGAAGTPTAAALAPLAARRVALWPDADKVGIGHMERVRKQLAGLAAEVVVVHWSEAPAKADAADFVALGGGREEVLALVAKGDSAGIVAPTTWRSVDLAALLAGDLSPLEPTVARREDGLPLLYPGRVHDVHAAPENLKSWLADMATAEVLNAGGRVLVIDFEAEAREKVGRLLALGVAPSALTERLDYRRPDEPFGDSARDALLAELAGRDIGLTVIDGVNAALSASGFDPNSNLDVRRWWDRFLRPLQLATAGPTVTIDHVTKDAENRGQWAVGAGAKLAGIDGASFSLELVQPFGRGLVGVARVLLQKDRPGALRGHVGQGKEIARLRLTSSAEDGSVTAALELPAGGEADATRPKTWKPTGLMEKVSRYLEGQQAPASKQAVEEAVPGRREFVRQALSNLVADGHVAITPGPRGSQLHSSVRPFREASSDPEHLSFLTSPDLAPTSPAAPGATSGTTSPRQGTPPYGGPSGGEVAEAPFGDLAQPSTSPPFEALLSLGDEDYPADLAEALA